MTSNQLAYAQNLETTRHNKESERTIDSQILYNKTAAKLNNVRSTATTVETGLKAAKGILGWIGL